MNVSPSLTGLLLLLLPAPILSAQLQFREVRGYTAPTHQKTLYNCRSGDVDGDGLVDLIYACDYQGVALYINDGHGGFPDETAKRLPPATNYSTYDVAAEDMDGDGDLDLVVANDHVNPNRILINNGKGVFKDESSTRFPTNGEWTTGLAVFDVDGDRDLDIFFYNYNQSCYLFLNNGAGKFTKAPWTSLPTINGTYKPSIATGDLDFDGDLDLLVEGNTLQVLENDGKGNFRHSKTIAFPITVRSGPIIRDLNGDTLMDVWFAGNYKLFLGQAVGGFKDVTATHLPGPTARYARFVTDVDLDGDLDLVGPQLLFLNDGQARFTDVSATRMPQSSSLRTYGLMDDLDGDGDPDLFDPEYKRIHVNLESQSLAPAAPVTGSVFAFEIYKKPGYGTIQHAALPLLGFQQATIRIPPFGILGIAPAWLYLLPPSVIPAKSGKTTISIPIPSARTWQGVDLYLQSATLSPSGKLRLGNLIRETIQ